ncbi:hypothetical protein [Vulcanococcus limneticus]|uniref:hypothetical protein n=1 Tax=Vulcanococcus limneticus TaxID=2170428 RepID=UPI00398BFC5A
MTPTVSSLALLANPATSAYFGGSNILFIHNWRTAGTSLHSLLKVNLRQHYIKIGDQHNRFGLLSRKVKPIETLYDVKQKVQVGSVIAGHIYAGVEAFFPADWDLWMSVREPLARVRSGLLRFHSTRLPGFNDSGKNIIKHSESLDSPESIRHLLASDLMHENNGMSRRLASMCLTPEYSISDASSIERAAHLSAEFDPNTLLHVARVQLGRVKILFMADYFHASVLSLEHYYNLPPLIHPFASLRHNSSKLVGYSAEHEETLDASADILARSQSVDLQLWPDIMKRFQRQIRDAKIKQSAVKAKEIIHAKPLFQPEWFTEDFSASKAITLMADAIKVRCSEYPDVAEEVKGMMLRWPCLTAECRAQLNERIS